MIAKFGVAGFRGIGRYQEIDLAPITIVTGPNSAGKSSLLEALRVSRNLIRTLDHETLIGTPTQAGTGRLYPEYAFRGDAGTSTQLVLTPDHCRDDYLCYWGSPRSQRGISISMTIGPVEVYGSTPFVVTELELSNEQGHILNYRSLIGRLRLHWDHPIFDEWLTEVRSTLHARAQDSRLVEPALEYFTRGVEATSAFVWSEPSDTDVSDGLFGSGADRSYDEDTSADSVGEFALCEVALMSERHATIVRNLVESVGVDEAMGLVFYVASPCSPLRRRLTEKIDPDLLEAFEDAILDVDLEARSGYALLLTRGLSLLRRIRSEVVRSIPRATHVSAARGTPAALIVEPPRKPNPITEKMNVDLEARVNTWLGSDKLGTGYRFAREPLLPASHAQAHLASDTMPDPQSTRIYQQYVVDLATGMRLPFEDVGYGVAQVLPVLLALYGRRNSSLHIEQPESHIHPALQADLADAAIISAKALGNQVAMETHSEHLILRLLRRIRETTEHRASTDMALTAEDVAIYYLAPGQHGATVTRIHISDDGDFTTRWPQGFFPERLQELG